MNKKVALLLIGAVILPACAKDTDEKAGCSTKRLHVVIKPDEIKLAPQEPKCVLPGTRVPMKITSAGGLEIAAGDVMVKPKINNPGWLTGDNSKDPEELTFDVPEDASAYKYYNYMIEVKDVGILDPIVKVVGQNMYMKASESDMKEFDKSELDPIEK